MRNKPPIALLSHRFGNIGHTFMSLGVTEIVKDTFGHDTKIDHFEQHHHFSVYGSSTKLRLIDKIPHGKFRSVRRYFNSDKSCAKHWPKAFHLNKYEAAIACGGPNLVKGVAGSAEMSLMYKHMYGAFNYHDVPFIDLAIGSCYPINRVPESAADAFSDSDKKLLKKLFSISNLTTVRDPLAKQLCSELGHEANLTPCAALCSGPPLQRLANISDDEKGSYILLNFQESGANQDWGQNLDKFQWTKTIKEVVATFEKEHRFVLICHSAYELKVAQREFPEHPSFFPKTPEEYAKIACKAKIGIASRIHCAIPLAGMGIPSVVFGTDTRLNTVKQMGLPTKFTFDATTNWINETIFTLLSNIEDEAEKLRSLRENTMQMYKSAIQETLTDK